MSKINSSKTFFKIFLFLFLPSCTSLLFSCTSPPIQSPGYGTSYNEITLFFNSVTSSSGCTFDPNGSLAYTINIDVYVQDPNNLKQPKLFSSVSKHNADITAGHCGARVPLKGDYTVSISVQCNCENCCTSCQDGSGYPNFKFISAIGTPTYLIVKPVFVRCDCGFC